MKIFDLALLADENIDPRVLEHLLAHGVDGRSVVDLGLQGATDRSLMRHASVEHRFVLTHDSDFGALALKDGEPVPGIVYLRPGHASAEQTTRMLDAANSMKLPSDHSILVVVEERHQEIRIRIRRLP